MALFDEVYNVFGLSYNIVFRPGRRKTISARSNSGINPKPPWLKPAKIRATNTRSTRATAPSMARSSTSNSRIRWAGLGNAARFSSTSTCRTASAATTSMRRARRSKSRSCSTASSLARSNASSASSSRNYGGAFPTWLAPVQCNVLPVNGEVHGDYAKEVQALLVKNDVRCNLDDSNEKLGYRLTEQPSPEDPLHPRRRRQREGESDVTYRVFGDEKQVTVSLEDFVKLLIRKSIDTKIFFKHCIQIVMAFRM
jgi:hypothetical protein